MFRNKKNAVGLHILGKIYTDDIKGLKSVPEAKNYISKIIRDNTLKELGSFYYEFSEGGFTGVISLVESHIAIHTWPEFGYLTLDVYICNYSKDNSVVCKQVFEEIAAFFKPFKINRQTIKR